MSLFSHHQWRALLFLTTALLIATGWRFVAPSVSPPLSAPALRSVAAAPAPRHEGESGGAAAEGERATEPQGEEGADREETAGGNAGQEPGDGGGRDDGRVDINAADAALLQTLPGIGPVLAQRIIEYRETWGPFDHPTDLMEVSGIGPRTFERLRDYIRVGEP